MIRIQMSGPVEQAAFLERQPHQDGDVALV
jgi:hypothetical protein